MSDKIIAEAITLPTFLSEHKCRELLEGLREAEIEKATRYLGSWDESTQFAIGVVVERGVPSRWAVYGPMNRDEAREYLTLQRASFVRPASDSRH